MVLFIVMILIGFIGIIASFMPPIISSFVLYGMLFVGLILSFVLFILFVIGDKQKKRNIWFLISCLLYILYFFFLTDAHRLIRGYYLVDKHMKNFSYSYKIIGINGKKISFGDNNFCPYLYNVQLNDQTGITFQSGYCNIGYMWTQYDVIDNYSYYYVPYYYEQYKKINDVSFSVKTMNKYFDFKECEISFNESSRQEVCEFLYYLKSQTKKIKYRVILYNIDSNKRDYFGMWNSINNNMVCFRH